MELNVDKNNYIIAKKYAIALMSVAVEHNAQNSYIQNLEDIFNTFKTNSDLYNIISSSVFDKNKKKEILSDLFKDKIDKNVLNFLFVLADSKHFDIFETILYCVFEENDRLNNVLNVCVTSAVELTEHLKEKIFNKISSKTKKNIKIDYKENPDIIAGLVISMDEKIIDLSLRHQFEKFEKQLI